MAEVAPAAANPPPGADLYLRDLIVSNFRGIRALELPDLSRIMLVGGLNGSGKTTLLEAIFTLLDRYGPLCFLRSAMWRGLPGSVNLTRDFMFLPDDTVPVEIVAKTREGNLRFRLKWENQPIPEQVRAGGPIGPGQSTETGGDISGVTLETFKNNSLSIRRGFLDYQGAIQVNDRKTDQAKIASAVFVSNSTIATNFSENATRFTQVVQNRSKRDLIDFVRIALDDIVDLQLLQLSGQSHIHVELRDGAIFPIAFAGNGAQTLVTIGLSIMSSVNGMVLLDEFDTAIHYSKLTATWAGISKLSRRFNCQIFAATHSKECIQSAVEGIAESGHTSDLQFIRLDRLPDKTVATRYSYEELSTAVAEDWDVR